MDIEQIKIVDVIPNDYSDFLLFCLEAGKTYLSEISNVDLVAFRSRYDRSREYVSQIRSLIDKHEVIRSTLLNEKSDDITANDPDVAYHSVKPKVSDVCSDALVETANNVQIKAEKTQKGNTGSTGTDTAKKVRIYDWMSYDPETALADIFNVDAVLFEKNSIFELRIGGRLINCLMRANITTVGALLSKTIKELINQKKMGNLSLDRILKGLRAYILKKDTANKPKVPNSISKSSSKNTVDPEFLSVTEKVLEGESYSDDKLTKAQARLIRRIENAAELVGAEICKKSYLDPRYCAAICNMLYEFALPYIQYSNAEQLVKQQFDALPDSTKELCVIPLIKVYSVIGSKSISKNKLSYLTAQCSNDTTVKQILYLIDKSLRDEKERNTIAADIVQFLKWLNFDVRSMINQIAQSIKETVFAKKEKAIVVFRLRAAGETLELIGERFDVTRERIRQLESKAYRIFWNTYKQEKYDLLLLIYILKNGDSILRYDEIEVLLGDDLAKVLWESVKHNKEDMLYFYSKSIDSIVIKLENTELNEESLTASVFDAIAELPGIIEADKKETLISDLSQKRRIPVESLNSAFEKRYNRTGSFYHIGRLTVAFMCEYVLKHRFPAGFKIADEYEAGRFKQFMIELFGERAESVTYRAIDADVGTIGLLCDRGKYIHPDYLEVDDSVINAVYEYVDNSSRSLFPYGEIFDAISDVLEGTQITNKYLLQGAIKKYGCKYSTGRDYVSKNGSVTLVDEIESFIEERGTVHKSEIFAEFTSVGDALLGQIISRSANVFNIDNGYYIHADQFDIQPEDYELIRAYLSRVCAEIPVNIRAVREDAFECFPNFMYRNDLDDINKLFAALNYMFRDEFHFSRPYIAKLGVGDITNRSVILQHIEEYERIEIEELIDICDENSIHYITPSNLCHSLAPDYFRISRTTMMKQELTGITKEVINQVDQIIEELLAVNDYIVGAKITDYLWYPHIDIDWNEFLLENLIVYSKKIATVNMIGDPLKRPIAIYITEKYKNDTFDSFLVKILRDEVHKGSFTSKTEMRDWLREKGLIEAKLPNFLESTKYFYVDTTGVHCTDE